MRIGKSATLLTLLLTSSLSYAAPQAGDTRLDKASGMTFVWIPKGCFQMGSNAGESDEQPVHDVCVKGFWLGQTEVTQSQYQKVMGDNPSHFKGGDLPVETVSWHHATEMGDELSYQMGKVYRLPSEAEWEYACTAGGQHRRYCGGGGLGRLGWYEDNSGEETHAVGKKRANAWGLYDMSGNVWEWVQDCRNGNYKGAPSDGRAWMSGDCDQAVLRGGSWLYTPDSLRSANRSWDTRSHRLYDLGFRLVQDR